MFCLQINVFHKTSGFAQITQKKAQKRAKLTVLQTQKMHKSFQKKMRKKSENFAHISFTFYEYKYK